MTSAGQMRERVTFQQRGLDENGDRLGAWQEPGLTVWARVRALKGGEPAMQQRLQGTTPVEVTVYYSSATKLIDNAWRLVWRDTAFNIRDTSPDERRASVVMLATADQSDA